MTNSNLNFLCKTFIDALEPHETMAIDTWVDRGSLMMPSVSSEPGLYSLDRTPYQREVLRAMSPDAPARTIILCWGSQLGKTTIENAVMAYYISQYPSPQAFAFSDDKNLKSYVNFKFNPLLTANPSIRQLLKSEGRGSGDTNTAKQYPGGFLKFLSGQSEASMRSDSVRVAIGDEVDGMGKTEGGDVLSLLKKRTTTFADRKICLSSTPLNGGLIYGYLQNSTFEKFYMPCPHCGEPITFEIDMLDWKTVGDRVVDAWMKCPHCDGEIRNEDKLAMLSKGQWKPTNTEADETNRGFSLNTFYAPVGWVSFTDVAQEYYEAGFSSKGLDVIRMKTFYNTILGQPYVLGMDVNKWKEKYRQSLDSPYRRGKIPSWVNVLTSGTDVQGNRLETKIVGWGKCGRHIEIDALVYGIDRDESMDDLGNQAWYNYRNLLLDGTFEREDGYRMSIMASALDAGYNFDAVMTFWLNLPVDLRKRVFPTRGTDRDIGGYRGLMKTVKKKNITGANWWQIPVSTIKQKVFADLKNIDNDEGTTPYVCFFPSDFDQEFYMQLYAEDYVQVGTKMNWVKNRDRNEQLDLTVYNYAMFYQLALDQLLDSEWDEIAEGQRYSISPAQNIRNQQQTVRRTARRTYRGLR